MIEEGDLSDDYKRKARNNSRIFKDSQGYYKLRSFCVWKEGDKEQPCQNTLMWSHYADSRNSFRVVYKLSPDMRFNKDHASYLTHRGMNYRSKSIDLTEEDEDHYSIQLDQESYVYAIISGMKCSDSTKSIIRSIMKNKRVRYYEMQEDPQNVYCLKLHEISNSEKGLIE